MTTRSPKLVGSVAMRRSIDAVADLHGRPAVLRQALLGDVHPAHHLDPADDLLLQLLGQSKASCSTPSMRMRTTSVSSYGCTCTSDARACTASNSTRLTSLIDRCPAGDVEQIVAPAAELLPGLGVFAQSVGVAGSGLSRFDRMNERLRLAGALLVRVVDRRGNVRRRREDRLDRPAEEAATDLELHPTRRGISSRPPRRAACRSRRPGRAAPCCRAKWIGTRSTNSADASRPPRLSTTVQAKRCRITREILHDRGMGASPMHLRDEKHGRGARCHEIATSLHHGIASGSLAGKSPAISAASDVALGEELQVLELVVPQDHRAG